MTKLREFRHADEEALLDWLCTDIFDHEQHPERLRELIRAECRVVYFNSWRISPR